MVRPYAAQFLDKMADFYDIVVFTAGMQDYADWALQHIGKSQSKISHRLYRQHALPCREFYIKDLSMLGRDLSKTIIVDNISESFLLQPENGITIKSWYSDDTDTSLLQLAPLLISIVQEDRQDIREALRESKEQLMQMIIEGEEQEPITLGDAFSFEQASQESRAEMSSQDGSH